MNNEMISVSRSTLEILARSGGDRAYARARHEVRALLALTVTDAEWPRALKGRGAHQIVPLYTEQPTPVAVVLPERSPKDYAIEHAEYMAKSADDVLAKFQSYGLALLAVDEGGDDGEDELFEAIDTARGDLQESLVDLRSMVYEFRKRCSHLNPPRQVNP